jgi:hypothetical protein
MKTTLRSFFRQWKGGPGGFYKGQSLKRQDGLRFIPIRKEEEKDEKADGVPAGGDG